MTVKENADGFEENHEVARKGGNATGAALKKYEKMSGEKVVSAENFKKQIKDSETPKIGEDIS